ncbi:hypothetical protein F9U64_10425 [Gracilibacillus oryzae]|uniref:Uncharacterized protein n=1 Tax=Gracilibacillus oryzae TaxID=1672701 RepID=A0A7C8KSF5_9BACI|nr:hypothetical protein [Gracilibacillus oryzae]KAB8136241.1 hypothetical protein F9U64_10425 [Gracilibacillus oryzae]
MDKSTKHVVGLIGSFLIFAVGLFRIVTESLSSTPLFVAYIFAITGFIGVIANGVELGKRKKLNS